MHVVVGIDPEYYLLGGAAVLVVENQLGHAEHSHLSPDRHETDGHRQTGAGTQNCDDALFTATPAIETHPPPPAGTKHHPQPQPTDQTQGN